MAVHVLLGCRCSRQPGSLRLDERLVRRHVGGGVRASTCTCTCSAACACACACGCRDVKLGVKGPQAVGLLDAEDAGDVVEHRARQRGLQDDLAHAVRRGQVGAQDAGGGGDDAVGLEGGGERGWVRAGGERSETSKPSPP